MCTMVDEDTILNRNVLLALTLYMHNHLCIWWALQFSSWINIVYVITIPLSQSVCGNNPGLTYTAEVGPSVKYLDPSWPVSAK